MSGEYSTTYLYLCGISAAQSDWLMWQLSHLDCASLPRTTQLYSSHFLQTYLPHLQLAESIATASPWCEAVLYSPDPPFLFGGGSGYKTTLHLVNAKSVFITAQLASDTPIFQALEMQLVRSENLVCHIHVRKYGSQNTIFCTIRNHWETQYKFDCVLV